MVNRFVQVRTKYHTVQVRLNKPQFVFGICRARTTMRALWLLSSLCARKEPRKKKRDVWCKDWLIKMKTYSDINLLSELKIYPRDWHNYLRMNEKIYFNLLSLVTPLIKKHDMIMREAATPLHHTRV
jgi:hypothetical protein